MLEYEEILELIFATGIAILVTGIFIFAWMTTYVYSQPLLSNIIIIQDNINTQNHSTMDPNSNSATDLSSTPSSSLPELATNFSSASANIVENASSEISNQNQATTVKSETKSLNDNLKTENLALDSFGLKQEENHDSKCSDNLNIVDSSQNCNNQGSNNVEMNQPTTSTADASQNSSEVQQNTSHDDFTIKLKFLDDTLKIVMAKFSQTIESFKRANFEGEMHSNKVVRLIFNGRLLSCDEWTLRQYGLYNDCVVHCYVTQPRNNSEASNRQELIQEDALDLSKLFNPLLFATILFVWFLKYEYNHIFNFTSTMCLIFITLCFLVSQYAFSVSVSVSFNVENAQAERPPGQILATRSNRLNIGSENRSELTMPSTSIGENLATISSSQRNDNLEHSEAYHRARTINVAAD